MTDKDKQNTRNATSKRAKAGVSGPIAEFAQWPMWKKLLMAGVVSGAVFGIYFVQQHHSVGRHPLVQKMDEPQRPMPLETQRQADDLETERRAAALENERQAQLETQREAERTFQTRLETATHKVSVKSGNVQCKSAYTCEKFVTALTIVNNSAETISEADFGWAFVGPTDSTCPSTYPAKKKVQVNLRPGELATLNMEGTDGPPTVRIRYCVGVTGVAIVR